MNRLEQKNLTRLNILDAISFGGDLFNSIASETPSDYCTDNVGRKRYYSRLQRLVKMDLINRKSGRYLLTPFGKVIYAVQLEIGKALTDHLRLRSES
jgi:predicted transcriptional regulator